MGLNLSIAIGAVPSIYNHLMILWYNRDRPAARGSSEGELPTARPED